MKSSEIKKELQQLLEETASSNNEIKDNSMESEISKNIILIQVLKRIKSIVSKI